VSESLEADFSSPRRPAGSRASGRMLRSSMLHSLSRIASARSPAARATAHFLNNSTTPVLYHPDTDRKFFFIKNRNLFPSTGKLHDFSGHLAQRSLK
jgi:hypothetical protein